MSKTYNYNAQNESYSSKNYSGTVYKRDYNANVVLSPFTLKSNKSKPLHNFLGREVALPKYNDRDEDRGSGKSNQFTRYPSTTYETRKSAFMAVNDMALQTHPAKSNTVLGRIDWAAKYLTYGQ